MNDGWGGFAGLLGALAVLPAVVDKAVRSLRRRRRRILRRSGKSRHMARWMFRRRGQRHKRNRVSCMVSFQPRIWGMRSRS